MKSALLLFLIVLHAFLVQSISAQTTTASHENLLTINDPQASVQENFDDPRLHDGVLKQTVGLMLERSDFPTYSRELWRVQWRTGDPINLYIIKPLAIAKPPVVIYLYGFPATADRFLNDAYCQAVTSRGLAAVGFESALTGARYHDRPWKEWFVSDLPEALGATTHDVQMILNFLDNRPDLDMQRVGMFGQGSGATIAVLAAANDPRLKVVDLLDPWGDWSQWVKESPVIPDAQRTAYTVDTFQQHLTNLDPAKWLPLLAPGSVRLQQTSFNSDTPADIQQALMSRMPANSPRVHYKSVDEYKSQAAEKSMILEWISNRLH